MTEFITNSWPSHSHSKKTNTKKLKAITPIQVLAFGFFFFIHTA